MEVKEIKSVRGGTRKQACKAGMRSFTKSPRKKRRESAARRGHAGARLHHLDQGTKAGVGLGSKLWPERTRHLYRFEDERYYRTSDPELAVIASRGTLAKWRCMGIGPPFIRFGGRILYLGKDLNDWLDRHRVKTFEQ